ncbi:MAG: hypothetical protein RLZZ408_276 [Verrucomicrobiota bacterium]
MSLIDQKKPLLGSFLLNLLDSSIVQQMVRVSNLIRVSSHCIEVQGFCLAISRCPRPSDYASRRLHRNCCRSVLPPLHCDPWVICDLTQIYCLAISRWVDATFLPESGYLVERLHRPLPYTLTGVWFAPRAANCVGYTVAPATRYSPLNLSYQVVICDLTQFYCLAISRRPRPSGHASRRLHRSPRCSVFSLL